MKNLKANPFKFGDPVEGDFYLPRPDLAKLIRQFLENHIHIVLMGPRRFGKTSFVLNLIQEFDREGFTCIFLDIFNITSHKDFLLQLLRAIRDREAFLGSLKKLWAKLKKINPQFITHFDPVTGNPHFSLTLGQFSEEDTKAAIQDLLEELAHLGKHVIVAIDEFQKISEIEDNGWLEATIRTHFQKLKNTSFLFTGSRKSLISEMLNDSTRPFYRSCQMITFPTFGEEFTDWVMDRFASVGITCDRNSIEHLRNLVQDTPNYVQMVAFHLVAQAKAKIDIKDVEEALESVVRQNAYAYQTLLNSLTLVQQRILRLAANEKDSIFRKELLQKYEIASTAALHSSISALKKKGILDEEEISKGRALFDDPLFAYWLRICFSEN